MESTNKILKDILESKEGTASGTSTNAIVRAIATADEVEVPDTAVSTNSILKAISTAGEDDSNEEVI